MLTVIPAALLFVSKAEIPRLLSGREPMESRFVFVDLGSSEEVRLRCRCGEVLSLDFFDLLDLICRNRLGRPCPCPPSS